MREHTVISRRRVAELAQAIGFALAHDQTAPSPARYFIIHIKTGRAIKRNTARSSVISPPTNAYHHDLSEAYDTIIARA